VKMIQCRFCYERGPSDRALSGLCPIGRGGVHEAQPVPEDLFGAVPALPPPKPVDPVASEAGRNLRASRRDALAAGLGRAKLAGDKQEKLSPGWINAAVEHVVFFGRERGDAGFLMEDAAQHAYANGLPQPSEKRAWGALPRKMAKEEPGRRLERLRFETDGYGSPKSVWRIV
jgi:hypothetical protein